MGKKSSVFLILMVIIHYFSCGPSMKQLENQTILPEIDVVQVKEYSEEALKLAQESKMDVQMLTTKITDVDSRLALMNEEVSNFSPAKLEELENRLAMLVEAFKELHEKVASIEVLPQITVKKKVSTKAVVFSATDPGKIITSSEYDQYQEALRTYDKRAYPEALKLFSDLLEKFPQGDYADRANYWIGECYYASAEYAKAVVAFTKVVDVQNSSKSDDAQLKLGLSYLRLGKSDLAGAEFKRLISRFPASEYVPRAQKYLAELRM